MRVATSVCLFVLTLLAAAAGSAHAQAKNLLFFGNSFTIGNGGDTVPSIVQDLATAAGHPTPVVYSQAINGYTLANHITKVNGDGAASVVHASLPAGQTWDHAVVQEYSTAPTTIGNTSAFRADAVTLTNLVRNHSPNAEPVLFETWARAPGHSYYPSTFASPAVMQAQVRSGYNLALNDLNAALPGDPARLARVGDGFEAHGFTGLYNSDLYHANNRGSLLAGLVLYSTIYDDPTLSDINLAGILADLNLTSTDGTAMASVAQTVVPEPAAGLLLILLGGAYLLGRRHAA